VREKGVEGSRVATILARTQPFWLVRKRPWKIPYRLAETVANVFHPPLPSAD
jgi:hypothetical protein